MFFWKFFGFTTEGHPILLPLYWAVHHFPWSLGKDSRGRCEHAAAHMHTHAQSHTILPLENLDIHIST